MSDSIWHHWMKEPNHLRSVYSSERIVVVLLRDLYRLDIWEATEEHGWKSSSGGTNMQVADCHRWAWERDVIRQAIGGVR